MANQSYIEIKKKFIIFGFSNPTKGLGFVSTKNTNPFFLLRSNITKVGLKYGMVKKVLERSIITKKVM